MANFEQHLKFAAVGSGVLATVLLGADMVTPLQAMGLWLVGSMGGILPDIDSDNSTVLDILFGGLSLIGISLVLSQWSGELSTVEIWLLIAGYYVVMFHIIRRIFEKFTVHRGIFHSIIGGLFFGFLTTASASLLLGFEDTLAWLTGSFLLFGFLTHLVLDEIYSVDFMNVRIKRSFGTALKVVDYNNWTVSALMTVAAGLAFALTPNFDAFSQLLTSQETYLQLKTHFLP